MNLQRDDPALAATCVAQPDANVKGIRSAVKVYEVPWQLPDISTPARPVASSESVPSTGTTVFVRPGKA